MALENEWDWPRVIESFNNIGARHPIQRESVQGMKRLIAGLQAQPSLRNTAPWVSMGALVLGKEGARCVIVVWEEEGNFKVCYDKYDRSGPITELVTVSETDAVHMVLGYWNRLP
jgi:hypothetical protein